MGRNISDADIKKLIVEIDEDGGGEIEFCEFLLMIQKLKCQDEQA